MPTLPEQQGESRPEPHELRQTAESFGVDAARYDRARPAYPEGLITEIIGNASGASILDVGTGTGIAARQFEGRGCRVLGVEPDGRMADFARTTGIDVEVATFEEWDSKNRTFDILAAGQAWHWVDPQSGAEKAARVLKPGGTFAVFWHLFLPPDDIAEVFGEAFHKVASNFPIKVGRTPNREPYKPIIDKTEEALDKIGFHNPKRHLYTWQQNYTRAEYLDLLPTQGGLTRVPQAQQEEVLTAVGAAIDARGGQFACDYTTVLFTATR
ncbi:class I SAM-dependent methyltransferase [Amycolatopsis sp. NPDC047767]|uniref:class I SAM-dependent methyltransferase n=1 Tax=Amycolatopsis sp. NPDC047767 TaxID=3156765 RepID=UPI0034543EF6